MTAADILLTVTLAISGWTLHEVIHQGKLLAALKQQMKDLPCGPCQVTTPTDE